VGFLAVETAGLWLIAERLVDTMRPHCGVLINQTPYWLEVLRCD